MDEERLNEVIRQTLDASRRPPEPPFDAMWAQIEYRAFDMAPPRRISYVAAPRWRAPALAAAAALAVGVGLGWYAAPRGAIVTRIVAATPQPPTQSGSSVAPPQAVAPSEMQAVAVPPRTQPTQAIAPRVGASETAGATRANVAGFASRFDDIDNATGMSRYLVQTAALLAALPSDRSAMESDTAVATRAGALLTQTHLLLDSKAGSDPTLHRLLEDLELVLAQVARLRGPRNAADLQLIHQALTVHDVLPRVHDATVEAGITD